VQEGTDGFVPKHKASFLSQGQGRGKELQDRFLMADLTIKNPFLLSF